MLNGRRVQLSYKTREAAAAEKARRKGELVRAGQMAWELSDEERLRFIAVRNRLAAMGATVEQACGFYEKHGKPLKAPVTWEKLDALCRQDKEDHGASARYLKQLKCVALSFARAGNALRLAHEVSREGCAVLASVQQVGAEDVEQLPDGPA